MEIVNVRLPDKLTSDIDKLAKKHNLTRSEVMRQALTIYLHLTENIGTMLRPVVFQVKPAQIAYTRRGDVSILKIPTGHAIVVGSTSSGAIGSKEMDKVKVEGRGSGKVLSKGSIDGCYCNRCVSRSLSVTLGVEKEPTGNAILEGISREEKLRT
jgi:hypothetical protein